MEDSSVIISKLASSFMHPVPTCCPRITNMFKHGRYSCRCKAFIYHGFDLLL